MKPLQPTRLCPPVSVAALPACSRLHPSFGALSPAVGTGKPTGPLIHATIHCPRRRSAAFARVDLLVVIGILALLAGLSFPLLGKAKDRSHRNQCLINVKQLNVAWHSYSADHNGEVVPNHAKEETRARRLNWVNNVLSWGLDADNTNLTLLKEGKLAPYVGSSASVYQCPTDHYVSPRQRRAGWMRRTRSVSMNAFLGNSTVIVARNNLEHEDYIHALKVTDIASPSGTFLFLDQHADGLDDGNFFVHPELPPHLQHWHDIPSSGHNGSGSISFADGHADVHYWGIGPVNLRMTYADLTGAPTLETIAEKAGAEWLSQRTSAKK